MTQFIKDLKNKDDDVDSYFAVVEKDDVRGYIGNSKYMFSIKVSDKTGIIMAKFWGGSNEADVKAIHSTFKVQDVISIKGKVNLYRDKPEIAINPGDGHKIIKIDSYDKAKLIETSKIDLDQMKLEFKEVINKIQDPDIKRLLNSFFDDEEFMKKFTLSPAAKDRHHNFQSGLLEHVLSLIKISKKVVEIHPQLDLDLLISGCIFHDIGKISEYDLENTISYTREGDFLGHISIGYGMVFEKINTLENFPALIREKILHLILSHHGEVEFGWGSAVNPKIPEAIALHYIDQVDAKVKACFQEIENSITDDEWMWTRDKGRLYKK